MPDIETIAQGDDSRVVEARRFLVRDRQAFAAIWAAHAGPDADRACGRLRHADGGGGVCGRASAPGFTINDHRHAPRRRFAW